ncbi:MAG: hypothetical protein CMA12_00010 [Euryarchaeota archaeon]|nr:hypothetical protein [Euryarchaeota archaeon]|tara:strand:+ start:583 stop:2175 length:1593 start_codon:yes stop_codon:yes gene_type:complete
MLVLITTAGIGERLKPYTAHLNKGILPFRNKPAIIKIIDAYPSKTKFLVCVGYKSKDVINILAFYRYLKRVKIIKVDKFDNESGSLTYTLKKAIKYINEPFFYHANDSMIDSIPKINKFKNTIFLNKNKSYNDLYRKVIISKNTIEFLSKKTKINNKKNIFNYVGICFIYDYKKFSEVIKNSKLKIGESEFIEKNIKNFCYNILEKWVDIGNIHSFEKNAYSNYNVLPKSNQQIFFNNDYVLKYFNDPKKINNLIKRSKKLKTITPILYKFRDNFVYYKFINGKMFNNQNIIKLPNLLNYFNKKIWRIKFNKKTNLINHKKNLNDFYREKTFSRVKSYLFNNKIKDNWSYINNFKVDKIYNLLEKINWDLILTSKPSLMHGDLHFENILIGNYNKIITLDIRDDFKNINNFGDQYYDLAKILHGIIISHNVVNKNLYFFKKIKNKIIIKINKEKKFHSNLSSFYKFCNDNNLDINKIELLCSLIYLNIADLHHSPYSHFLFNLGKLMLMKFLNKIKKNDDLVLNLNIYNP